MTKSQGLLKVLSNVLLRSLTAKREILQQLTPQDDRLLGFVFGREDLEHPVRDTCTHAKCGMLRSHHPEAVALGSKTFLCCPSVFADFAQTVTKSSADQINDP